jgi:hypothetical protein
MGRINRDQLIEKIADSATESADIESLESFFREGQINFLDKMTDRELIDYAQDILGYDIEED